MIKYQVPELMNDRSREELFTRFLLYLNNKDPFSGCPLHVTIPLQGMIMSFSEDYRTLVEDMFSYVEAILEEGYMTKDTILHYIDISVEITKEDIDPQTALEIKVLKDYINGASVYQYTVAAYLNMMRNYGFDYSPHL